MKNKFKQDQKVSEDLEPVEGEIRMEDLKPGMIVEVNYVDDPRTITAIDDDYIYFTTGACATVSCIKRIVSSEEKVGTTVPTISEKNKYISIKDFTIERFMNERDREYGDLCCREYNDLMIRLLRMTGNETSCIIALGALLPFMEEIETFKNHLIKYGFIREEKVGTTVPTISDAISSGEKVGTTVPTIVESEAVILLKRCIKHWKEILYGGEWKECALCGEYNNKWHWDYNCIECPIYRKTIAKYCINTPYSKLFKHSMDSHDSKIIKIRCATCHRLVVEELELLNGLLKEEGGIENQQG